MYSLNRILVFVLSVVVISFVSSCSNEEHSAFYPYEVPEKPPIPKLVEGAEKVITGRIGRYDGFGIYTWNFGEAKIYAVLDTVALSLIKDINKFNVVAEGTIDEYGQYQITLPAIVSSNYVRYADELSDSLVVQPENLIISAGELELYAGVYKNEWGTQVLRYEKVRIDDAYISSQTGINTYYYYAFFSEDGSIEGDNDKNNRHYNVYGKKGWNILQIYSNSIGYVVHIPPQVRQYIWDFD